MESLILSQNTCWKQKIGYKMSGTLRGEIWGLSFAVAHSVYSLDFNFTKKWNEIKNIPLLPPISAMQRDSGASGNACILKGVRQSLGSEKK